VDDVIFSYNATNVFNSCKQAELVTIFKRKRKSKLFYLAYDEQPTQSIVSSHRHKAPLIRSRHTALYKFVVELN